MDHGVYGPGAYVWNSVGSYLVPSGRLLPPEYKSGDGWIG